MNIKTTLKTTVAAAALFAVAVPVAEAGSVSSGGDSMAVTLSGHFNKAVAFMDSGSASRMTISDNDISQSRFRIIASGKMNEQVSVSGTMEMSYSQNNLSGVGIVDANGNGESGSDTDGGGDSFGVRHGYLKFSHASMGSFSIGHTSQATDGAANSSFNPAGDVVDAHAATFGGVQVQADGAADNTFSGTTVGQFFSNYDGGRTDVVKYATPSFGGFSLSTSYSSSQAADVAASFGGKFGGIEVSVTGGYRNDSSNSTAAEGAYMISGGVKHDSGLSLSGGYAKEDAKSGNAVEGKSWFALLGYEANLTSMGATGFAVQYSAAEDTTVDNDEGDLWSVGVEQDAGNGIKFYAGAHFYDLSRTGTNYEDVTTVLVGTKVAF